jgi:hypothetical protein
MIQRELAVDDDIQSHIGGPSSIVDSGQFNILSSAESVVGDSSVARLAVRGMRWYLNMTMIRSHTT